jgi:hypothetical protein
MGLRRDFVTAGHTMWDWLFDYWVFYNRYFWTQWDHLGPTGYTTILTTVGVFGYIAMKGRKRN